MDLPYDIKELISSHLEDSDLLSAVKVDAEFRPFLVVRLAPIFRAQFIHVTTVLECLRRIWRFRPTMRDVAEDGGDHRIMSYVLDKEIEPGEYHTPDMDYNIWNTMTDSLGTEPTMTTLIEMYNLNKYDFDTVRLP